MPDSAVHESIYQNYEIHGSWVRRSGTRVEPLWPHSENAYFSNIFFYTTVQGNIRPCYISPRSPSLSTGEFKTR